MPPDGSELKVLFLHGTFNVVTSIGATSRLPMTRELTSVSSWLSIFSRYPPPDAPPFSGSPQSPLLPCRSRNTFLFQLLRMVRDFNGCSRIGNITTPTNSEKRMTPPPGIPARSAPGRRYHPARAADREHTSQSDRPTHPGERRDRISRVVHEPNSIGFFFRKRL